MGGQGSGGERQGKQGKMYAQRTDLAADRSMTPAPSVTPQAPAPQPAISQAPIIPQPIDRPTEHPQQDPMHGVSVGPGAGPEALGALDPDSDVRSFLYALYDEMPSAYTAALIDDFENNA